MLRFHNSDPTSGNSRSLEKVSVVIGGLVLASNAGCGNNPINTHIDDEYLNGVSFSSTAKPELTLGGNMRYDPWAYASNEDGGVSNSCGIANQVTLYDVEAKVTNGGIHGDLNGSWIGVPKYLLPDELQESCATDKDNIIWIAAINTES